MKNGVERDRGEMRMVKEQGDDSVGRHPTVPLSTEEGRQQ